MLSVEVAFEWRLNISYLGLPLLFFMLTKSVTCLNDSIERIQLHFSFIFTRGRMQSSRSTSDTAPMWPTWDGRMMIGSWYSVGGADTSIMVWSRDGAGESNACGDSDDSDTDSEEEGEFIPSILLMTWYKVILILSSWIQKIHNFLC